MNHFVVIALTDGIKKIDQPNSPNRCIPLFESWSKIIKKCDSVITLGTGPGGGLGGGLGFGFGGRSGAGGSAAVRIGLLG